MLSAILSALMIGAALGTLGRLTLPGRRHVSIALTIFVGVVAALIATAVLRATSRADADGVGGVELALQATLAALGVGLVAGRRPKVP